MPDAGEPFAPEYIVVGSGAGGGTVAARLAESGRRVLLLEAGGDPRRIFSDDSGAQQRTLQDDYDVPVFHTFASEHKAISWDFFVRHYASDKMQQSDDKYCSTNADGQRVDGILYPRCSALGGCTAHNAQILIYPHNADWDCIAAATGDESWSAPNMRKYFTRIENCGHRWPYRLLRLLGIDPTRHGWNGWLHTEKEIPKSALGDLNLVAAIFKFTRGTLESVGPTMSRLRWLIQSQGDPNDWRWVKEDGEGIRYTPLTTNNHSRMGARERVLDVAKRCPQFLRVELNALVTKVLFNGTRAIGVSYRKGEMQYRAGLRPWIRKEPEQNAFASREVILSGGAFNTPQLLLLSGIGPPADLQQHGIATRVDLPGVGKNLQDRYEIGVVNRMNFGVWEVLKAATFSPTDPQYREWSTRRSGVYASNGAVLGIVKRSKPERPLPDLFCFSLLGYFKGYYPGYSLDAAKKLNYLTWAILKAHTNNVAGEVKLRSTDPCDPPLIDFHYFGEGTADKGEDLDSVVAGIKFIRALMGPLKSSGLIAAEEEPGDRFQSDDELRDYVKRNAWGHHASCTCPIGNRNSGGVLDGNFKVHGTSGLRVVDASVFPRIPGFFIASAVYMIGEKAAEDILRDASENANVAS